MKISNGALAKPTYAFGLTVLFCFLTLSAYGEPFDASTKRLACFYYDKTNPHDGTGFFHPGLPYVWAKGLANENIYIDGILQDGFFTASSVMGKTRGIFDLYLVGKYKNDETLAQSFCQRGLKHAYPNSHQNKVIIHIGVKNSLLSPMHYPVVFQHQKRPFLGRYNKLIVFGDSLSDQGNLKNWLRLFPREPYFAGRFSNRQIWVDYVQQMTGIAVQNWAYAGSVANPFFKLNLAYKTWKEKLLSRAQVRTSGNIAREISRFKRKSLNGGLMQNANSTLISLWIGSNDYLSIIETNDDVDIFLDQPEDPTQGYQAVVSQVTDNIIDHIHKLYALGARNFFVTNLPNFGKSPRMLKNSSYHRNLHENKETRIYHLSEKVTQVVSLHNQILRDKLTSLEQNLPDLHLIFGDVAETEKQAKLSIDLQDGVSFFNYDFDHQFQMSFTFGDKTFSISKPCYEKNPLRRLMGKVCREPDRAAFWDDLHPTSYGHCLVAASFHQQAAKKGALLPATTNDYFTLCRPELIH